jgi:hydrogenase nickel incorporation protein HypA/HybF
MHERGLVQGLLRQIQETVPAGAARSVCRVHLTLGAFAGVEPELLRWAFEELAPAVVDSACRLEITVVPLQARCAACQQAFAVEHFHFVCPVCDGERVTIIAGEELELTSVTLRAETAPLVTAPCEEIR